MVTTKKIAIEYTQKEIRNKFKYFTIKKKKINQTQKKTVMQEMRDKKKKKSYKVYREQIAQWQG